jgi:hypothetical protein
MKSLPDMLELMAGTENEDAFREMQQVLELEILRTHDPVLLWRLGQIYRQRKIWQDAERLLNEAIKWSASMPEPYRDLGLLHIHRDDVPFEVSLLRAKEILEKGVRADKISNDRSPVTHS